METIADILAFTEKPQLISHIKEKCGLGGQQHHYIQKLAEAGLLDAFPNVNTKHAPGPKTNHSMIYTTSRKGKEFLKVYAALQNMLTESGEKHAESPNRG